MNRFWEWFYLVAVWSVVASWVSYFDVTSSQFIVQKLGMTLESIEDPYLQYLVGGPILAEALLFGGVYGTTFFIINRLTDTPYFNEKSAIFIIGLRTLLYTLGLVFEWWASTALLQVLEIVPPGYFGWSLGHGFDWPYVTSIGSLVMTVIILLNISFQVIKKYGQGNVISIFLGKYHRPQIEERIFLFMDLKSSTTYAERLGPTKFTRLIQVIFNQVNRITRKYRAQIYNYVGDEVILTWPKEKGLHNANCVRIHTEFMDRIQARSSYFEKEFGLVPEFRAGLHGGKVSVAEVGIVKRDISYFGDVVNSAARLQALCRDYDEKLLTTAYIADGLAGTSKYSFEAKGRAMLKGKKEEIEVFAIRSLNHG